MFFYFGLSETYRIINVAASASNLSEIHPYLMIYALSQHRRLRSRLFGISSADRRARAQFRKLDDLRQRRQLASSASERVIRRREESRESEGGGRSVWLSITSPPLWAMVSSSLYSLRFLSPPRTPLPTSSTTCFYPHPLELHRIYLT